MHTFSRLAKDRFDEVLRVKASCSLQDFALIVASDFIQGLEAGTPLPFSPTRVVMQTSLVSSVHSRLSVLIRACDLKNSCSVVAVLLNGVLS